MNKLRNSLVQPAAAAAPERWSVTVAAQDTVSLEIPADAQRERSFDEAAKLAEQGDRSAQTRLAWMYEAGGGVPRNLDEAARRFTAAAEAGDPEAQYALAMMFRNGKGKERDLAQSEAWLRHAAGQNYPAAVSALASAAGVR